MIRNNPFHVILRMVAIGFAASGPGSMAAADSAGPIPPSARFPQQGGQALYEAICQGCHMPDAEGAKGAGAYPALTANKKLEEGGYPVHLVVYGQKAMPAFGGFLSDEQVADVVNYIRTHFSNNYDTPVKPDDVKAIRQPDYNYVKLD
ncbi:MAG TPA: cytochrome c [Xanthobacteraceae bacterium]|nr:cytochrome c [Xanthobacteraceae bacterium]